MAARVRFGIAALACALLALAQPATAQQRTLADPAAAFGARESVCGVDLSPDGRSLIYLAPGPRLPIIRFADASDDENVLLIWAGSDSVPGRYYTCAAPPAPRQPVFSGAVVPEDAVGADSDADGGA